MSGTQWLSLQEVQRLTTSKRKYSIIDQLQLDESKTHSYLCVPLLIAVWIHNIWELRINYQNISRRVVGNIIVTFLLQIFSQLCS